MYLNSGVTASCHRASKSAIPIDFDSFHNTEIKKKARRAMLEGQWPGNGCEYCQQIENSDGVSDRIFQNQIPDIYPHELDQDSTLIEIQPSVLEIFFSNTCNLACVYCIPELSSAIEQEWKKYKIRSQTGNFDLVPNQYKQFAPKFWKWFEHYGNNLKRLQILGGEPFLQQEVMQTLIHYFQTQDFSHLEFNLVTNLSIPNHVIDPVLDQLTELVNTNRLKRVDIQVSIDCWGETQEYSRWRINLDQFERNLQHLIDLRKFRIGLLSTVNSLSIHQMPQLAEKYRTWSNQCPLYWYMHLVAPTATDVFDPKIFDYSVFKSSLAKTRSLLPPPDDWDVQQLRDNFDGIDLTLQANCQNDQKKQKALVRFLDDNDARRGSQWRPVFPWLDDLVRDNNVV